MHIYIYTPNDYFVCLFCVLNFDFKIIIGKKNVRDVLCMCIFLLITLSKVGEQSINSIFTTLFVAMKSNSRWKCFY